MLCTNNWFFFDDINDGSHVPGSKRLATFFCKFQKIAWTVVASESSSIINILLQLQQDFLSFFLFPWGLPWSFTLILPAEFSPSVSRWAFLELRTRFVIARNISSTFIFSLADVSKSWIPIWLAKRDASSFKTTRRSGSSHLLPTRIRLTSSQFWLISWSHLKKHHKNFWIILYSTQCAI